MPRANSVSSRASTPSRFNASLTSVLTENAGQVPLVEQQYELKPGTT